LGGSYYLESLTHSLGAAATVLIDEVEALGGMTKAVEAGMPKLRIEEAAARRQAAIDRGEETIVGVNKYRSGEAPEIELLDIDNSAVRAAQLARLERVRHDRDPQRCGAALAALTEAARNDAGNLLALSIEAMRARATVGEVSDALEQVFTRHRAQIRAVSGVYGGQYQDDDGFRRVQRQIEAFARDEGRRPRMLVVKLGQDGHDRGAKIIATAFADIGFDVDIGPLFQTPEEAARQAVENDVHIVGVSSQAAAHKTLVPALIEALRREGAADILTVCGGVIPPRDYDFLKKAGVSAIYGPGTNIPTAAAEILSLIQKQRLAA
jgi:methylmalonyl-CoA mutase